MAAERTAEKRVDGGARGKRRNGSAWSFRVASVFSEAAADGLTDGKKSKQLSGRVHGKLYEAAAAKSGLRGTELVDYALAKVALEDDFAERLLAREGSVSRDVDLEF